MSELCASKEKFLNSNSFNGFSEGLGLILSSIKV